MTTPTTNNEALAQSRAEGATSMDGLAAVLWACTECAAVGEYGKYLKHQRITCHGELRKVVGDTKAERDAFWAEYKAANGKVRGSP